MLTWCVSVLLLTGAQAGAKIEPPQAAKGDAAAKLKECCSKVSAIGSYAYDSTVESEGGGFGGPPGAGGGRGAGGGAPPGAGAAAGGAGASGKRVDTTNGKVEIGKSAELKRGETLAYKLGDKLVYKKGGAWEVYVAPDFSGGAGGGAGGPPGGGRGAGGGEGFAMMSLANHTLPHDILRGIDAKLKDVKGTEADGKWTFTGTLTDAGADEVSGAKRAREMAERFAAGSGASVTASGTATILVGKDGNAEQIIFDTKMTTQRGESKRKQTIALKDWGKTKVEVPADVATKLSG